MNYYSYLVEHDFGLAPNPFGGYCTLTVCKPQIRKSSNLHIGDWIIGTGSNSLRKTFGRKMKYHLIYAMKVSEIIAIENYWNDPRFKCKKPILNGSLALVYGDNFYHKDVDGKWIQEDSAHSNPDGSTNFKHLKTDVSGKNAVVSDHFYYFGQSAPILPIHFRGICHVGRGRKLLSEELGAEFISWLTKNYEPKIHGRPINWVIYNQQSLLL
jgi:hypothetical protein